MLLKSEKLYKDSDLVIHEVYLLDKRIIGHECIINVIEMAKKNNIKYLALVHLNKHFRKNDIHLVKEIVNKENSQTQNEKEKKNYDTRNLLCTMPYFWGYNWLDYNVRLYM